MEGTLYTLFGAVFVVLLLASANLANLTLARNQNRSVDDGLRLALGSGTRGLIRLRFLESAVLCFLGASLGILIAGTGIVLLIALVAAWFPARLAAATSPVEALGAKQVTRVAVFLCLSLLIPLGLAGQDSFWGIQRLGYTVQPERDSGGGLGLTLGGYWRVRPRVSFGVEAGYHRLGVERHSFVDPTVGQITDRQQESIYQFGLIMVGELAQGRWRPYFLAGPVLNLRRFETRTTRPDPSGPVRTDGKSRFRGSANDEGVTGGFGVMAPRIWDPLGLAFEFRWFAISRGVADDDFFSFEEVDHNFSFTVGLVF